jgi:hypothetical protein
MNRVIQAAGCFDPLTDCYSLSIGYKDLCFTLDGLSQGDLLELHSCLECLCEPDAIKRQAHLSNTEC